MSVPLEGDEVVGMGDTHAGWFERKRQREERKQRKCFPSRHPHCLFPVRVSPESSGLVNLISCQNSHDNESRPAAGTAAPALQPSR